MPLFKIRRVSILSVFVFALRPPKHAAKLASLVWRGCVGDDVSVVMRGLWTAADNCCAASRCGGSFLAWFEHAFEFPGSGVAGWTGRSVIDIGCCADPCISRCWLPIVDGTLRIVMHIPNAVYSSALVFSSFCCFCFSEYTRRGWGRGLLLFRLALLAFTRLPMHVLLRGLTD